MRRYMKVLASTAMLGAQVAMPELAFAQAQCPPIGTPCVVGVPQGPAPCPVAAYCSTNPGGYGYTGGGGSGGSNSIPENEATAPQPAPPPVQVAGPSIYEIAKKAAEQWEKPCKLSGEGSGTYTARAMNSCINYVKERLPFTIVPSKDRAALQACDGHRTDLQLTGEEHVCRG